jgi:hypothetical protein
VPNHALYGRVVDRAEAEQARNQGRENHREFSYTTHGNSFQTPAFPESIK